MFLLRDVSSDILHEKDRGIYSGGDLRSWASAVLAREGAVAPGAVWSGLPAGSPVVPRAALSHSG
jgi:hypothetical protein